MIVRAPWWLRMMIPHGIFRIENPETAERLGLPSLDTRFGRVYITFDDGPVPEATPWVLEVLDRFGVKAAFFMVGENALRYPSLVAEVRRRGHRIANHAHRHRPGLKSTTLEYVEDARLAEEAIGAPGYPATKGKDNKEITVERIFRPPHGYIRLFQQLAMRICGYKVVLFDVVSRDYDRRLTSDRVTANVLNNVRDGSVVVFHDSVKAMPRLKEALPEVLAALTEKEASVSP